MNRSEQYRGDAPREVAPDANYAFFSQLLKYALLFLCCLHPAVIARGHEAVAQRQSYDLPGGDASRTLYQFAEISNRRLIFMVAKVRGVRTNAIKGEFTPSDALEAMLSGTDLRVLIDAQSGSFVITRRVFDRSANSADGGPGARGRGNETGAPKKGLLARAATLFGLATARGADAPADAEASALPDEVVVLSPFEVLSSSENGYVATSSLLGSRVRTDLRDVASQIDVLTPEFLDDIGADSIADAVAYSSNFGAPLDQNINGNDSVTNLSGEGRARGMDLATVSTDFFATKLPIDFYNIERLNLAYGAQSVLFGLGGAGGVLDSSTKRAQMRDLSTVEFKIDSWGSERVELDYNRVLVPERLAVRLIGLLTDADQFTPEGNTGSQRGFATITYRPFSTTSVRASFETVDVNAQRATNYVSLDFVTPWISADRPLYDNSQGNAGVAGNHALFNRNQNAISVLSYGGGTQSVMPWTGSVTTKGPHQIPGASNPDQHSLTDASVYPVELDPRVAAREDNLDGRQFRMSVEQRITPDLFFELAFNHEERNETSGGVFDNVDSLNVRGDANRYLPGGTVATPVTTLNPNAGKLFIESFPHGVVSYDSTQELRLTGFYEFRAAEHLGDRFRWLGRHRISSLLSTRRDISESQDQRAIAVGETSYTTGDKLNVSRLLRVRYYLDSPGTGGSGNYFAQAIPGSPILGPYTLSGPANGAPVTYALFDNPEGSAYAPVGTKVEVDTAMIALQSFFLGDRINGFVGLRQDRIATYYFDDTSTTRQDQVSADDRLGLYQPLAAARYTTEPEAEKSTLMQTYGVVCHPLSWVSLFYNTSENTSLPPGFYGPFGDALQGVSSYGRDYGVRLSLLSDRITVRLNFFDDNQIDNWANPFNQLRNYAAVIEQRLRGVDRPDGIGAITAASFDPVGKPVELYRSLTDKAVEGLDFVVVANPMPNWSFRAAVGHQVNKVKRRGTEWIEWIDQRLPVWQSAGGLGWDNVTVSSTDNRTIHQYYDETVPPQIAAQELAEGILRFRERQWRANVFTNYHFVSGPLKGFNLGGGVRWWGRGMTGHGGQTIPGLESPVNDPSIIYRHAAPQVFCDLLLGYRHRVMIGGRSRLLTLQLNVRNLFDEDDLEVSRTDQAGIDYEYVRVAPRQIIFSTRMSF